MDPPEIERGQVTGLPRRISTELQGRITLRGSGEKGIVFEAGEGGKANILHTLAGGGSTGSSKTGGGGGGGGGGSSPSTSFAMFESHT